MPKKQNLNELMRNVPSPKTTHTRIMIFLFAILAFSTFIYVASITYTGLAVIGSTTQENTILRNQNIFVSNRFEVVEIGKSPNSVLDLNLDSSLLLNVFVEIDDCFYWKQGQDRDNTILYTINGIKNGNFKIGNPADKTVQQIDLYKTDYLCLVLINREFPKTGNVNVQYKEAELGKWSII